MTQLNAFLDSKPDETEVETGLLLKADQETTHTKGEVNQKITDIIGAAPAALNTLNELAAALNNDASYASTITNALIAKAPIANPTFTGTVFGITKGMINLGNIDNTSGLNKPISISTQSALNLKANTVDITKKFTGLGNVDNTSDLDKPISTSTQSTLNLNANASDITKTFIGLGSVDNTSDASKPISALTRSALNLKSDTTGFY